MSEPAPIAGAIVPHAPLLIPAVGRDSHPEVPAVRAAVANLDPNDADLVVVLSPHGSRTGVYRRCRGDLSRFGVNRVTFECKTDSGAADQLASGWGVPVVESPVDHGVLVPLTLLSPRIPVIAACLDESAHGDDETERFVKALQELSASRRVLFVASANTSAASTRGHH